MGFLGEIKSTFNSFQRVFIWQNLSQTWECAFNDVNEKEWKIYFRNNKVGIQFNGKQCY